MTSLDDYITEIQSFMDSVERFTASLEDVFAAVDQDQRYSVAISINNTIRYYNILKQGLIDRNRIEIIRSLNLFSGINKGVSDTVWIELFADISEQALSISNESLRLRKSIENI